MNQDRRQAIIQKAYELGFEYEKTYRGCAQCTLATFFTMTGRPDPALFQAASGLSGGIAITGDGSCGRRLKRLVLMSTSAPQLSEMLVLGLRKFCWMKGCWSEQHFSIRVAIR